jgi:hypothetical protein
MRFPDLARASMKLTCAAGLFLALQFSAIAATVLPPSERVTISLGETQWKYLFGDPSGAQAPTFNDSAWTTVGIPYSADQLDTFINVEAGGGDGDLNGPISWYRNHFTLDASNAGKKVLVEFEGTHTGVQVYINGTLLPGISAVPADAQATHVVGFIPVIVDLTPFVKFDGSQNVLAVRAAKNASFFEAPGFSQAFRFGQSDSGLFRPVNMYLTNPVHIPQNVYSNLGTWGTYVATVSASDTSAVIEVQTNVLNEGATAQPVTVTTQIVDADGNVVAAAQSSQTLAPNALPGLHPQLFDQQLTVTNPTLWYPNNSTFGKPYMYKVFHVVSINGTVVDAVQSPLGIRTITWDQNFPNINGHPHYLWGASGRYDYPALGTAVPEEQKWRDLQLLAAAGGNLWRPGHSTESEEFVNAADAYGIMIVQPSGEGEGAFSAHCSTPPCDIQTLKSELHRDMIIRDRSHPSILAWEADNGPIDTPFAQSLKALSQVWDPINTRVQADRTPNPANGDIMGCTLEGCEVLVKQEFPANPAWGSEYWGTGTARQAWDFELAFAAPFLDNWRQGRAANAFGMAQWYFADSPGETSTYVEGVPDAQVRSLGASMTDMNRFPKMLYYIYEAAWTPFQLQPVVHLAHHWNRSGAIQVNAFSNCPAVRLLINGVAQGSDQVPNPWNSNAQSNLTQSTTLMPFQVHWNVTWAPGTATAECLDAFGNVLASDSKVTAGPEDHIELDVVPELTKPDGTSFTISANGSDAAFIVAKVVDAQGNLVSTAADNVTFAVTGPATYVGGTEQYVTLNQPVGFHAPGDPELQVEGGMTKVALRSQFTAGAVTVTATAPGLKPGTATYSIGPIASTATVAEAPSVIVQPVAAAVTAGQTASFSVTASGAAPLTFQWKKNGTAISGATGASYQTPATTAADNGAVFTVVITNAQGATTSSTAALSVVTAAAPTITTQPAAATAAVGQSAQFSVVATGSPTLAFQWFRNGTAIAGATGTSYVTPVLGSGDNGAKFTVAVSNPVGQVTSATAALTVNAAAAPSITTQPQSLSILANQPATFGVAVAGSAPFTFQWQKNGTAISGATASSFTIAAIQPTDAATYTVVVTNIVGSVTSTSATLTVAPPGVNLALGKTATASSSQDPVGLAPALAFDGDLTTRWASAQGIDPSWLEIDLGSVQAFDRVILHWENAFATMYQIQWSNDNATWNIAFSNTAGVGGVEDFTFPTVNARYVRMFGQKRATQFGYSLFEFQIFNVPQCGGPGERFTVLNPTTVQDNQTHLSWARAEHTLTTAGSQFTQPLAASYCIGIGMRLPTLTEALSVSGASDAQCAFPQAWTTWTSTLVPNNATFADIVSSSGASSFAVANNFPGGALCTQGTSTIAGTLAIVTQPAAQSVALGQTATFSVTATGSGTLTYQWSKNGTAISGATQASFTTPATVAADNGAGFTVAVTDATGAKVTSSSASLTVTNAAAAAPTITTQPAPQSVALGKTAGFAVVATGAGPLTYQWFKNGTAIAGATSTAYVTPATVAADNGASFKVVVTGPTGATATSNAASLTVTGTTTTSPPPPAASGTDLVAIAAGTTAAQGSFAADKDFIGGGTTSHVGAVTIRTTGVADAASLAVYQSERNGIFSYTVPGLTAGTSYTLRLHFAEFYWTKPGQRVFNVTVNNAMVLPSFDVVAAAGGPDIAIVKTFTATANSSGQIVVNFLSGTADQPKLSGIEIVKPGTATTAVITTQPTAQTASLGQAAAFTVVATGTAPLTYQWFKNGTAIAGATSATYKTPATVAGDTGAMLSVIVTAPSGEAVTSNIATLTVTGAGLDVVAISAGAAAPTANFSADMDFTGGGTTTHQGLAINTAATNAAPQAVYDSERNGTFTYTVPGLTAGTVYPVRLHFAEFFWTKAGQRVFNVAINGTKVLSNFDIIAAAGAPETAIVESFSATANSSGQIVIAFTNGTADQPKLSGIEILGPQTAPAAAPPAITTQPAAQTVAVGQAATFTVAATGTGTLTYQWFRGSAPISGATAASYTTPATVAGDNGAVFDVVVTAAAGGAAISKTATLTVTTAAAPPVITTQPAAQTVAVGKTATFTVAATGTGTLTFQWFRGGTAISGAIAASFTTPATVATDSGAVFDVVVTATAGGATTSKTATLTVTGGTTAPPPAAGAPVITAQPQAQAVIVGRTAQFAVGVSGGATLSYQWQKNGVAIPGANAATYGTPGATAVDNNASFTVLVGNAQGTVSSAAAVLSVNQTPAYTVLPGFIGTDLNNNTNGAWQDSQIFVEVLGNDPTTGALSWVNFDGTVTPVSLADNTAPNHLTANGQSFPNYAFSLAQSKLLKLPPLSSGRIYISEGSPLFMEIVGTGNSNLGYAGPNPQNATDPNIDVHYDWYEFTYGATGGIFINTTQVDEFGLPLLLDVWGNKETFHMQTGINEPIAQLDQDFVNETPAAFHLTAPSSLRIFAPANSTFDVGEANATYLDSYISSIWSQYATTALTVNLFGGSRQFSGVTSATQFVFTENNLNNGAFVGGTYTIGKPTTQDILRCNNTMAEGNTVELALEAQFCAAFNRHVMQTVADWTEPSTYYVTAPANFYAQFWHDHAVAGLAYGFAYDDVNNQSSLIQSPTPEHMAFGIGW